MCNENETTNEVYAFITMSKSKSNRNYHIMLTAKASCTVKPFNWLDLEVQAYFAAHPDRQLMSP